MWRQKSSTVASPPPPGGDGGASGPSSIELVPRRAAAFAVDAGLVGAVSAVVWWLLGGNLGPTALTGAVIGFVVFTLAPVAFNGSTPGKRFFGLRVTTVAETSPRLDDHLIRAVVGLVDLAPFVVPGLVGLLSIRSSSRGQRLGDRLASTMVVERHRPERPPEPTQRRRALIGAPPSPRSTPDDGPEAAAKAAQRWAIADDQDTIGSPSTSRRRLRSRSGDRPNSAVGRGGPDDRPARSSPGADADPEGDGQAGATATGGGEDDPLEDSVVSLVEDLWATGEPDRTTGPSTGRRWWPFGRAGRSARSDDPEHLPPPTVGDIPAALRPPTDGDIPAALRPPTDGDIPAALRPPTDGDIPAALRPPTDGDIPAALRSQDRTGPSPSADRRGRRHPTANRGPTTPPDPDHDGPTGTDPTSSAGGTTLLTPMTGSGRPASGRPGPGHPPPSRPDDQAVAGRNLVWSDESEAWMYRDARTGRWLRHEVETGRWLLVEE